MTLLLSNLFFTESQLCILLTTLGALSHVVASVHLFAHKTLIVQSATVPLFTVKYGCYISYKLL